MNKNVIIFLVSLALFFTKANAQSVNTNTGNSEFPSESVFVHYNSAVLLAGEKLYYKLYCLNNLSASLSNISKVAFIELVGEGGTIIFKHRIKLEEGQGSGDFLINSNISSGNYKLVAYTKWMLNNNKKKYFIADLTIINPFNEYKGAIESNKQTVAKQVSQSNSNALKLKINKPVFNPREQVIVSLEPLSEMHGNISVSVSRINEINSVSVAPTSLDFKTQYLDQTQKVVKANNISQLPDIRGEIYTGRLIGASSKVSNKDIAYSVPNSKSIAVAKTDSKGNFNIRVEPTYHDGHLYAQLLYDDFEDMNIEVSTPQLIDYSTMKFDKLSINEYDTSLILERSVHNQIENAYAFLKKDSILIDQSYFPFDNNFDLHYDLDDYNRFSTMKEVFVEIVNQVQIKRVSRKPQFVIQNDNGSFDTSRPPLLLLDGIIIKNAEFLIGYNAREIKTIQIIKDKYYLGSDIFNGIISFKTIENDFNKDAAFVVDGKVQIDRPQPKKIYDNVVYSKNENSKLDRIPDYRRQLYWNSNLSIKNKEQMSFYTSDLLGDYEIRIEGFTSSGAPISLVSTFTVK